MIKFSEYVSIGHPDKIADYISQYMLDRYIEQDPQTRYAGSGKSWALEIMAAYTLVYNFQIQMGETKRCLYWRNVRTDPICDEYTSDGSFERFKKMNIIGIQDLGAEPAESMYMGNRVNVMRQILEYRGDQTDKITLITSNLPMSHKTFLERYDGRVASRLNEMCNYFEIKGKDKRNFQTLGKDPYPPYLQH